MRTRSWVFYRLRKLCLCERDFISVHYPQQLFLDPFRVTTITSIFARKEQDVGKQNSHQFGSNYLFFVFGQGKCVFLSIIVFGSVKFLITRRVNPPSLSARYTANQRCQRPRKSTDALRPAQQDTVNIHHSRIGSVLGFRFHPDICHQLDCQMRNLTVHSKFDIRLWSFNRAGKYRQPPTSTIRSVHYCIKVGALS